jgi:RNA polymerase sigma-70 factor (ECF subfamily)
VSELPRRHLQRAVYRGPARSDDPDRDDRRGDDGTSTGRSATAGGPLYHGGAVSFDEAADEHLVRLALDGDEDAFGALVRRYQRRLTAFLGQLVGDLEVARELSQEAFVRAWSALDRFNPRYRFSTWLFRIGHNLAIDHLRRRRLKTVALYRTDRDGDEVELVVEDTTKDPLGHFENGELAACLRQAIEGLRPEYRELVLLRHFGGLSYQEIADLKEMPLGTVKNKLFRAHTVLRNALATFL